MNRRRLAINLLAGLGVAGGTAALLGEGLAGQPTAPDFGHAGPWINIDEPTRLPTLRGRLTLVNFWTYSCINVLRTLPYLRRWHSDYAAAGLQIVGIHTPEFGFEARHPNVEKAVRDLGILYPVAQDNAYRTWRAWNNRAWPSFHVVDQAGRIVLLREGEGHASELEASIRQRLGLPPLLAARMPPDDADLSRIRSPELYFGAGHPTPQEAVQRPRPGEASYTFSAAGPRLNRYELEGHWERREESLLLRSTGGGLRLHFSAAKAHLVAEAPPSTTVRVRSGTGAWRDITVGFPALYTVVDGADYADQVMELVADSAGLALYSATFG